MSSAARRDAPSANHVANYGGGAPASDTLNDQRAAVRELDRHDNCWARGSSKRRTWPPGSTCVGADVTWKHLTTRLKCALRSTRVEHGTASLVKLGALPPRPQACLPVSPAEGLGFAGISSAQAGAEGFDPDASCSPSEGSTLVSHGHSRKPAFGRWS